MYDNIKLGINRLQLVKLILAVWVCKNKSNNDTKRKSLKIIFISLAKEHFCFHNMI